MKKNVVRFHLIGVDNAQSYRIDNNSYALIVFNEPV